MKKLTQNMRALHFAAMHNFTHDLDQLWYCAMTDDHSQQRFADRVRENYA